MKTIRVDAETHRRFKIACALRGVNMQQAATEALELLLHLWEEEKKEKEEDVQNNPQVIR